MPDKNVFSTRKSGVAASVGSSHLQFLTFKMPLFVRINIGTGVLVAGGVGNALKAL